MIHEDWVLSARHGKYTSDKWLVCQYSPGLQDLEPIKPLTIQLRRDDYDIQKIFPRHGKNDIANRHPYVAFLRESYSVIAATAACRHQLFLKGCSDMFPTHKGDVSKEGYFVRLL